MWYWIKHGDVWVFIEPTRNIQWWRSPSLLFRLRLIHAELINLQSFSNSPVVVLRIAFASFAPVSSCGCVFQEMKLDEMFRDDLHLLASLLVQLARSFVSLFVKNWTLQNWTYRYIMYICQCTKCTQCS